MIDFKSYNFINKSIYENIKLNGQKLINIYDQ